MDPQGDYLWNDVFPVVKVVKTNAQDMMIDLGTDPKKGKRFATLEFSSVGSGNAGKVRAENLLYCDDLVDGLESALSKEQICGSGKLEIARSFILRLDGQSTML